MAIPEPAPSWDDGWRRFAANPEITVAALLLALLVVISTLQVVMRYVFNAPLDWTQEISSIVIVWMTFIGAIGLTRQGLHARVELLEEVASESRSVVVIDAVFDVVAIVFLLLVAFGGWQLIGQLTDERTAALRLPLGVQLWAIPVSAALMAIFLVLRVVRAVLRTTGQAK